MMSILAVLKLVVGTDLMVAPNPFAPLRAGPATMVLKALSRSIQASKWKT